jgi:CRISPR/Cas system-associated exonuclease Cas4 (RecB family)
MRIWVMTKLNESDESDYMVKMFTNDPFAMYIYEKHIESIIDKFKKEKRFPCYSVGKLTSGCNRMNFYKIKDSFSGVDKDYGSQEILRMVMGVILHDTFELSDKAEWHLVYEDIYGHVDEYFADTKILMEKKTSLSEIAPWKQALNKAGGDHFKYLPGEEWENQLRYYALLLQKGIDFKTKKPANENNEVMVRRVYVLYYTIYINPEEPDKDVLFSPMIVPVPMTGPKWDINMIEMELIGKKEEIEECLTNKTVPPRNISPYRCPYCDYKVRCFYKDKDKDGELPEEIRGLMGKRSPLAKAQEFKG